MVKVRFRNSSQWPYTMVDTIAPISEVKHHRTRAVFGQRLGALGVAGMGSYIDAALWLIRVISGSIVVVV